MAVLELRSVVRRLWRRSLVKWQFPANPGSASTGYLPYVTQTAYVNVRLFCNVTILTNICYICLWVNRLCLSNKQLVTKQAVHVSSKTFCEKDFCLLAYSINQTFDFVWVILFISECNLKWNISLGYVNVLLNTNIFKQTRIDAV